MKFLRQKTSTMWSVRKLAVFLGLLVASCDMLMPPSGSDEFLARFEQEQLSDEEIANSINSIDEDGHTPLYRATVAAEPDRELIGQLIVAGADPFVRQGDDQYPIRTILSLGDAELFAAAACAGTTDTAKRFAPIEGNSIFDHYSTIVHDAAVRGTAEDIFALGKCGFDLGEENELGRAPLALSAGVNAETFQALLLSEAKPDAKADMLPAICARIARKPLVDAREQFYRSLRDHGYEC